jgi:hypothetical protein
MRAEDSYLGIRDKKGDAMKRTGLALVLRILCLFLPGTIFGQETKTTVADNRYGEGGSHTTISYKNYRTDREMWNDKDGKVREGHYLTHGHPNDQTWRFYGRDGVSGGTLRLKKEGGQWYLSLWLPKAASYIYSGPLTSEGGQKLVEKIEKQFSTDGRISEHALETESKVDQPTLPPTGDNQSSRSPTGVEQPSLPPQETFDQSSRPSAGDDHPLLAPSQILICQKVALATATEAIQKKIEHITERKKLMSDAYFYQGAVQTLVTAFKAKGVTISMSSADPWGKSGIGSAWSEYGEYLYNINLIVLNTLLEAVKKRGFWTEEQMKNLDQAMTQWDKADSDLETQFRALVDAYAIEAKADDEQSDYMARYFQQLNLLQMQSPYPANAINALNDKMYSNKKSFDERIKKMEDVDQKAIRDKIILASQQKLKFLTEAPDCRPDTKERAK